MRVATNDSQRAPIEFDETIRNFQTVIKNEISALNIDKSGLWNMDQTMVRFDSPSSRTNNTIGESRVRITNTGKAKMGFTVALCVSASGEKLPAFIIFKERSGELPRRVVEALNIPNNVVVTGNKNGWMTSPLLKIWAQNLFGMAIVGRNILILDQYRPHHTEEMTSLLGNMLTTLLGIPAGNIMFIKNRMHIYGSAPRCLHKQTV